MSTPYMIFNLDADIANAALAMARQAFPDHDVTLDRIDADNWALDADGLEWIVEYGSDHGLLVYYDHKRIVSLCGQCAAWLEYGSDHTGPDFQPSADLIALADSGKLDHLTRNDDVGYCDGCDIDTSYVSGGFYYVKRD